MITTYKSYEIRDEFEEDGINIETPDGSVFIYDKHDNLVGGGDSFRQAKHIINKMIEQEVNHESEIIWPIRRIVKK